MKSLRFKELLLLSDVEKSGTSASFRSPVTVIRGKNDRGKSCLIKSLYTALGATPQNVHPRWTALNVTLLLHFSVDADDYWMLKSGRQYGLFNGNAEPVGVYGNITKELGPSLADILDFRLELTNATSKAPEQATPACLFLPFYFDQDKSWTDSWIAFESLGQFSGYRKAVADFHTGIRPNEFYEVKNRKIRAEALRDHAKAERSVVKRVLEKIELLLSNQQFDLNADVYRQEVERLLELANRLKEAEEAARDELASLLSSKGVLERQFAIATSAAGELDKDFKFAAEDLDDEVECPTCGAHYLNSFVERFSIAADGDQLRTFLLELKQELRECEANLEQKRAAADKLTQQMAEIKDVLEAKQGEVRLKDVLQSEGKREVRLVLRKELDELNRQVGSHDDDVETAARQMKKLTSPKRSTEIKSFYLRRMEFFLTLLDVPELPEASYSQIDARIKEMGSDLPRALLAYYFAILKTIEKYSTSAFCPVVIDSPRQQDQDRSHWSRMLDFMRDHRPSDQQMIVGLVNDLGKDLGGDVIELTRERELLEKSRYDEIATRIRPFLDKMLEF